LLEIFALQLYIHAMAHAITMRELQKLSATLIERLPGAVPIQSDGRTVALLVPLRPASEAARARFRRALAQAQSQRSPEEQAALDREFGP
jgi:antitoxin (DNA-binding transcriptional repressor) of toxin-antitoxin stability system